MLPDYIDVSLNTKPQNLYSLVKSEFIKYSVLYLSTAYIIFISIIKEEFSMRKMISTSVQTYRGVTLS